MKCCSMYCIPEYAASTLWCPAVSATFEIVHSYSFRPTYTGPSLIPMLKSVSWEQGYTRLSLITIQMWSQVPLTEVSSFEDMQRF